MALRADLVVGRGMIFRVVQTSARAGEAPGTDYSRGSCGSLSSAGSHGLAAGRQRRLP